MAERVALIENGIVIAIVWKTGDIESEYVACPEGNDVVAGWSWDGLQFTPPVLPEKPQKTVFDGADFLNRITDVEYKAILAAAAQSIQIARWLDIFRLRGEIDVSGATAQAAKAGLVATKLLTPERADEIFKAG